MSISINQLITCSTRPISYLSPLVPPTKRQISGPCAIYIIVLVLVPISYPLPTLPIIPINQPRQECAASLILFIHILTDTPVTRSHKANDRDHKGIAEGTALPVDNIPRFFGKHGFADTDPKKMKKDGAGRGNW